LIFFIKSSANVLFEEHKTTVNAITMKTFRSNAISSILMSLMLLGVVMHLTQAQEEAQQPQQQQPQEQQQEAQANTIVIVHESSSNATQQHYVRGGSSNSNDNPVMSLESFEREMQQVGCFTLNAVCRRTNDCCDPLSCRSNRCQVCM
jgi:hypothetical protein